MDKCVVVITEWRARRIDARQPGMRGRGRGSPIGSTPGQAILCGSALGRSAGRDAGGARRGPDHAGGNTMPHWRVQRRWLVAGARPVLLQADPVLLLAPDSGPIRAWLPRLAVRWRLPLVGCCMRIGIVGDSCGSDPFYPAAPVGNDWLAYATWFAPCSRPGVRGVDAPAVAPPKSPSYIRRSIPPGSATGLCGPCPPTPTVALNEAERIVSGGFGTGGRTAWRW